MVCRVEWESGDVIRFDAVSDETTGGVSVESDHEEEGLLASALIMLEGKRERD
jgi:hypothetical protein